MNNILSILNLIIPKFSLAAVTIVRTGPETLSRIRDINGVASRFLYIGDLILYLLIGLGVIFIVYNTVWYFIRPNGESRSAAGLNILWGIMGLAIIVSIWGLVNLFINTFYTDTNVDPSRFPNANFISNQNGSIPLPQ